MASDMDYQLVQDIGRLKARSDFFYSFRFALRNRHSLSWMSCVCLFVAHVMTETPVSTLVDASPCAGTSGICRRGSCRITNTGHGLRVAHLASSIYSSNETVGFHNLVENLFASVNWGELLSSETM